jgi:hypothetical protein
MPAFDEKLIGGHTYALESITGRKGIYRDTGSPVYRPHYLTVSHETVQRGGMNRLRSLVKLSDSRTDGGTGKPVVYSAHIVLDLPQMDELPDGDRYYVLNQLAAYIDEQSAHRADFISGVL